MAGIGWNRLKITDWTAMAGAVLALVTFVYSFTFFKFIYMWKFISFPVP